LFITWYKGLFAGVPLQVLGIVNLLLIPYLKYYEDTGQYEGVKAMLNVQVAINFIYLTDLVLMLLIFGFKVVFTKRSWALRFEPLLQLYQVLNIGPIMELYRKLDEAETLISLKDTTPNKEFFQTISIIDFYQIIILVRLLRIFSFLAELEQWKFFMKAVKVMRGPFLNLCFTLYSLFFLYSLIGIEIFGGKINSKVFKELFELNPDTEIAGDYIWLNFNDYASGLITLFSMMLFNNWQFIWDQFDFAIESQSTTNLFFLSFMVMATYVIINILMAFVIDVYTSIEDAQKREREERKAIIDFGKLANTYEDKKLQVEKVKRAQKVKE